MFLNSSREREREMDRMVKQLKESNGVGNGRRWHWFDGGRPLSFEKDTVFLSLKKRESGQRTLIPMQTVVYPHTVMWSLSVRLLSTIYFFC